MKLRNLALGIALTFALASCENPVSSGDSDKTPDTPTTPTSTDKPATPDKPDTPDTPTTPKAPKMLMAGYYAVTPAGTAKTINRPCWWEDGVKRDFGPSLGDNAYAYNPVVTSGETVYAAGYYREATGKEPVSQPCYWKGTEKVDLKAEGNADFMNDAYAFAIALSGDTVYAVGDYRGAKDSYVPCYWENGALKALKDTDGNALTGTSREFAYAYALALSGSDVYVSGQYYFGTKAQACYWKNGQLHDLRANLPADATGSCAVAIAVSGSTVYAAGYYYDGKNDYPCYWKNDEFHSLKADAGRGYATGITVSGDAVYTSGLNYNGTVDVACYWQGDTRHDLVPDADPKAPTPPDSETSGIVVVNGKVYVLGSYWHEAGHGAASFHVPCYWEGDAFHTLLDTVPEGGYIPVAFETFWS